MSEELELQKFIRHYKQVTGETEVDMHKVASMAIKMGMKAPTPVSAEDLLARKFSRAARQELRHDRVTGRPYRVNHAVTNGQLTFWVDIDEAPRLHMEKSIQMRREQMVGDAVQLTFDADHWNSIHPEDMPIEVALDFQDDVDWRKASEDDSDAA